MQYPVTVLSYLSGNLRFWRKKPKGFHILLKFSQHSFRFWWFFAKLGSLSPFSQQLHSQDWIFSVVKEIWKRIILEKQAKGLLVKIKFLSTHRHLELKRYISIHISGNYNCYWVTKQTITQALFFVFLPLFHLVAS